jgi:hypothetical protein
MKSLLSRLLCVFCMAWVIVSAQTVKSPFVVTISAEAPATNTGPESYAVKAGSDVFIKVSLTNTSKRILRLGDDTDSRTGVDFCNRYEIRDSSGNLAGKRTIQHPEIRSTGHGWPARILKPTENLTVASDRISGLYDLTKPGKYTIRVARDASGNPKEGEVKSNVIMLTVTD